MGLGTVLLIILILMLIGVIPTWPHSRDWGYGLGAGGDHPDRAGADGKAVTGNLRLWPR